MKSLLEIISNDKITVLGKEYTVARIGQFGVDILGSRGGRYNITHSPKATVRQDKSLPVFALINCNSFKSTDFTICNGKTVGLTK